MSEKTCAECAWGTITEHSSGDRCAAPLNTQGYHPYVLRHDETLCGSGARWSVQRDTPSAVYKASDAVKQK